MWKSLSWAALCASFACFAQAPTRATVELPRLQVADDGRQLATADGQPFFWMGDTAWELIHALPADDINYYLTTRAGQRFNVVLTVVLAELNGITQPTPEGWVPFEGGDPRRPVDAYFGKVEATVMRAQELGLYVALLPAWGDKVTAPWGAGPRLFEVGKPVVARQYGRYLGARLRHYPNVIWMMGGDRAAHVDESYYEYARQSATKAGFALPIDWRPIWNAMVDGIREGYGPKALFGYHPMGGANGTAQDLKDTPWLAFHAVQSGHGARDTPVWEHLARLQSLGKPVLDLEPNYEDHPVNPWPAWNPASGYFDDHDLRKQTYRAVFAGAAGATYGHHSIWQMAGDGRPAINHARIDWRAAMRRPGAEHMQHLRALVESRPMRGRVAAPGMIKSKGATRAETMVAAQGAAGEFAFAYFPRESQRASVDLTGLKARRLKLWWFDPRSGLAKSAGEVERSENFEVTSPASGPDWVLVIDDPSLGFAPPGIVVPQRTAR